MIIYGSRFYGKKDMLSSYGTCEQCGVYGPQRNYNGRRWGHLYWIPLIPEGPAVRVLHECKACKHAHAIPLSEREQTLERMREATDRALAALLAGKDSVDVNGVSADPVNEIGGTLDFLLALGEAKYVKLLVAALRQQPGCEYACRVCEALWAEFEGDIEAAEEHFRSALRLSNRSTLPAASLARLYMHQKKYAEAQTILEQVISATGETTLYGLLSLVQTRKGDHENAAKSYEALFRAMPGAALDKGIYKEYKKLCRKAKRPALSPAEFSST
jgi:tetratricopeptide (TPR) repeat protein